MRLACSRAMPILLLIAFVLLLCPTRALAQAAPPPPPPAREGSAEFAFVGTSGNASTQTIGLGGELINRPPKWVLRQRVAFVRNEAESELTAKSILFISRAEREIRTRLSGFGEYGYFRDRFAGVNDRNAVAIGLSYKLVNLAQHLLSIDGALGYLNESRQVPPNISSATYGAGAGYKWKLSESALISDDVRFTGTFAESDDWRALQNFTVTARLTQLFSLKLSNTVGYVHSPVPGFKSTDTNTSIALVAKF
jgi:putative salt-induced outer membrane protein